MKKAMIGAAACMVVYGGGTVETKKVLETIKQTNTTIGQTGEVSKSGFDAFGFKGDLRLRYESIEREDSANKYRNRYRLRLGATYKLTDNLTFIAGMRSGFGNPTSGNQTFLDDVPLKDYFFRSLRFNKLGFTYKQDDALWAVGRLPYLMYRPIKSQLIWDNDVSMHGINYRKKDENAILTLGINRPTLEEVSVAKDPIDLFIAQYVTKQKVNDYKVALGAGLYYYSGIKGNTPIFGKRLGNTLDGNGLYVNDYRIAEFFAETSLGALFGKPVKAAAGIAYNFGAYEKNYGYDIAFKIGKAKKVGRWQLKYSYTDLQEDAVFGAYSDSDNFGGGTAAKGHAVRFKYKAGSNLYLAANLFFNKLYESKSKTLGIEPEYERVQLDMIYKF